MKTREDAFWEQVVETLDLADADLARAEKLLAEEAAAATEALRPLPARESNGHRVELRPAGRRQGWVRRWPRASALVLGAGLVAAAGYWAIWGGQRSRDTLPYSTAMAVFGQLGQPMDHRRAAMREIYVRVVFGIKELKTLAKPPAPAVVQAASAESLDLLLRVLMELEVPAAVSPDDEVRLRAARVAADPQALDELRVEQVRTLRAQTAIGIYAITHAQELSGEVDEGRAVYVKKLLDSLNNR